MSDKYPRAACPITPAAYESANQRAERWRKRYEEAAAARDEALRQLVIIRGEHGGLTHE